MIKRILEAINGDRLLKQGLVDTNYYLLAQVGSRVIGLSIIPVFARLLTLEEFATYDLFILASGFTILLTGLGMDSGVAILISENKKNSPMLKGLLFTSLLVTSGVTVLLWGLSFLAWKLGFETQGLSGYLIHGLFLYTGLYQFNYLVYNFIRWLGNAKIAALINFLSYILSIVGGLVFMLVQESTLSSYVIGTIVGNILGVIISAIYARDYLSMKLLPQNQFRDLMKLSLPYVPTYMSSYLMQFIDRLIITTSFGLSTLGLYALVNRVGQVVTFSLQIISNGFRPIVTANFASEEGRALSRKIFNVYWIAALPIVLMSILLSPVIINLFGGEQYKMAIPILPYIVLSVWFLGSFFLFGFGYQIKRKTIYITIVTLSVIVLVYFLSFPLIKISGMLGVAQATVASAMVGSFLYIFFSEKLHYFNYSLKLMITSAVLSLITLVTLVH